MSGRKKKHRAEAPPSSGRADGVQAPPAAGKKQRAGRGKSASSPRWPSLAVRASLAGLILGVLIVSLSVISVTSSDDPGRLGPSPSQASGATPGVALAPWSKPNATPGPGAVAPSQTATSPLPSSAQGIDPRSLEARTKGDSQAPVVVTEWFDYL